MWTVPEKISLVRKLWHKIKFPMMPEIICKQIEDNIVAAENHGFNKTDILYSMLCEKMKIN